MIALIVLFLVGIGMAFFATQNMATTAITLAGTSLTDIPMYVIVLGSMLMGIVISWVLYMTSAISSLLTLRGKDSEIRGAQASIEQLRKENETLRIDNSQLKGRKEQIVVEKTPDNMQTEPLSTRIKHSLGMN